MYVQLLYIRVQVTQHSKITLAIHVKCHVEMSKKGSKEYAIHEVSALQLTLLQYLTLIRPCAPWRIVETSKKITIIY